MNGVKLTKSRMAGIGLWTKEEIENSIQWGQKGPGVVWQAGTNVTLSMDPGSSHVFTVKTKLLNTMDQIFIHYRRNTELVRRISKQKAHRLENLLRAGKGI